jgi:hypothetical protein
MKSTTTLPLLDNLESNDIDFKNRISWHEKLLNKTSSKEKKSCPVIIKLKKKQKTSEESKQGNLAALKNNEMFQSLNDAEICDKNLNCTIVQTTNTTKKRVANLTRIINKRTASTANVGRDKSAKRTPVISKPKSSGAIITSALLLSEKQSDDKKNRVSIIKTRTASKANPKTDLPSSAKLTPVIGTPAASGASIPSALLF